MDNIVVPCFFDSYFYSVLTSLAKQQQTMDKISKQVIFSELTVVIKQWLQLIKCPQFTLP